MTSQQIATSWISGLGPRQSGRLWRAAPSPRDALASVLREHLRGPMPLFIAFSGGVDSSILLAVATDTARRDGLPLPIPVTNYYVQPGGAEETSWQLTVLRHLRLEESWQRVRVLPENDLVGPPALGVLRMAGVCWPMAHLVNLLATCAELPRGAVLLTGDGGDEAFGRRRITPLVEAIRHRRIDRYTMIQAARALAPAPLRRWDQNRHSGPIYAENTWLRPDFRASFIAELLADALSEPLGHAASTEYWMRRNVVLQAQHNMSWLAGQYGVSLGFPLWSRQLTQALQREGQLTGWTTRSAIAAKIAGDVLPQQLINRTSKAVFNNVMFGPSCRAVAADWDGSGVDDELIDVTALKKEWQSELPHSGTAALLQHVALMNAGG